MGNFEDETTNEESWLWGGNEYNSASFSIHANKAARLGMNGKGVFSMGCLFGCGLITGLMSCVTFWGTF